MLDVPFIQLGPHDTFTLRDAVRGVAIFGATGSGKSSGSGEFFALHYMRAFMGGMVTTVKRDDAAAWQLYAAAANRLHDIVMIDPVSDPRINFLDYARAMPHGDSTENLVNLLLTVLSFGGSQNKSGDSFWTNSVRSILRSSIDALRLGDMKLTLNNIMAMIDTAPTDLDQLRTKSFYTESLCARCLGQASERQKAGQLSPQDNHDRLKIQQFFFKDWPTWDPRTRGNIMATFRTVTDLLSRGRLHHMFCTDTNIDLAKANDGKVFVLNFPTKVHFEEGKLVQVIIKTLFQRVMMQRDVTANTRPVFLWEDEAYETLTDLDDNFHATARDRLVCPVKLGQNLPKYIDVLGPGGENKAKALLGNLTTKIFHTNGDDVTNRWASAMIDDAWIARHSQSQSFSGDMNISRSTSYDTKRQIPPGTFTRLASGGPPYWKTGAIVFQPGRAWSTGKNYGEVAFPQTIAGTSGMQKRLEATISNLEASS